LDRAAGGNLLCTPTSHWQLYLIFLDLSPKSKTPTKPRISYDLSCSAP
jgi:hypothetical protein